MRIVKLILLPITLLFLMVSQYAFAEMTQLMEAIAKNDFVKIEEELKKDKSLINVKGAQRKELYFYTQDGKKKYIEVTKRKKRKSETIRIKGGPLHQAVLTKNLKTLKAVVKSVPKDFAINYGSTTLDGKTVLHLAIEKSIPEIVRHLLEVLR